MSNSAPTLNPVTQTIFDTFYSDRTLYLGGILVATDPEGQTLTYNIVDSSPGIQPNTVIKTGTYGTLSLNTITGSYTYRGIQDYILDTVPSSTTVTDTFTISATDSDSANTTANLSFNLVGANDRPRVTDESVTTRRNTPITINLADNLVDSDNINGVTSGTLTVTGINDGTITDINQNDGLVSFTPTPGFTGRASFTYTVTDADGFTSDEATISIDVGISQLPNSVGSTPAISGNKIVWVNVSNLYLYDISTDITTTITGGNQLNIGSLSISDNTIIWVQAFSGSDSEIFLHDITTGTTTQITDNAIDEYSPIISGNRIVWYGKPVGSNTNEIFLHDISTGTTTQITNDTIDDTKPSISGDKVVWQAPVENDYQGVIYSGSDIFLYDILTGSTTQIPNAIMPYGSSMPSGYYNNYDPVISENRIVWERDVPDPNETKEIVLYDLTTETSTVVFSSSKYLPDFHPTISGDYVVWGSAPGYSFSKILKYSIPSGIITTITENTDLAEAYPKISGNNVVWQQVTYFNSGPIYFTTLSSLFPVTKTIVDTVNTDTFAPLTGTFAVSGQSLTYNIVDGSPGSNPNTVIKTGTYGNLTLNTTTGAYTYNPNNTAINSLIGYSSATDVFTISATDSQSAFDATSFTVTLAGANDRPTATGESVTTTTNTPVTVNLADNLADIDLNGLTGATLAVTGVSNGVASFNQTERTVTFTPTTGFSGNASFTYTVTDAGGLTSLPATVSIAVSQPTLGNVINGTAAGDELEGTINADTIFGFDGNDEIIALEGNDVVFGGNGSDFIEGEEGHDTLYGGAGNDNIEGNDGNDKLYGEAGNDILSGDTGNDVLTGGVGSDKLKGGSGSDTFALEAGTGTDTISDFRLAQGDKIGLMGGLTFNNLSFSGNQIRFGSEVLAVLSGINTTTLSGANFVSF